jgi:hypothetical protein
MWLILIGLYKSEVVLQFNIIRTDIFIVPVLHSEALWDNAELRKPDTLIKMSCVYIAFNNGVKLQYSETDLSVYS